MFGVLGTSVYAPIELLMHHFRDTANVRFLVLKMKVAFDIDGAFAGRIEVDFSHYGGFWRRLILRTPLPKQIQTI